MNRRKFVRCAGTAVLSIALVGSFALAGCTKTEEKTEEVAVVETTATPVELSIFAANSLEKALPDVQALYTAAHPEVTFADTQFKSSGDLTEQIGAGATPDVLIVASTSSMDKADEAGYIDPESRIDMFGNDLVIVRSEGSDLQISSLADVAIESITKIAIGDAATVPAGKYANQALNSVGLYTGTAGDDGAYDASIADKIVLADKVGTAANYVATGDCQIGFVYSSDLYRYDGIEIAYTVPDDAHKAIKYPGAVLANAANADVAADFLNFCMTDAGAQKIWSEYGFEVL
ncbi:MAG: molybdate ABC transporter substrate-binding protein [Actinobacteria bacterium]|nr:molybdate ABC transporter substrate-binding protein [Actinomycetota bacterium]